MDEKLVSYILPVYNAYDTVLAAVQSVLDQTYRNIELLIIDDGSNDGSAEIIKAITDTRVKVITNKTNQGLIRSLNNGLSQAQGEFIARMDADDICFPERTEVQLAYLQKNGLDLVGSYIKQFGLLNGIGKYPVDDKEIKVEMLFSNPIVHPSILFRRSLVDKGIFKYDEKWKHVEDYALWIDMIDNCIFGNIPQTLLNYRTSTGSVCSVNSPEQEIKSDALRSQLLAKTLPSIQLTDAEVKWMKSPIDRQWFTLEEADQLVNKLITANSIHHYFDQAAFNTVILNRFLSTCLVSNKADQAALKKLSKLADKFDVPMPIAKRSRVFIKGFLN